LGIIKEDLNEAGQLLTIYSAFINTSEKVGTQQISASSFYRFQESL
jgi:hypothetical protein